ncbi:MAG: sulfatase-like hydrolase/transferase [Gemmatimonadales bacterium]
MPLSLIAFLASAQLTPAPTQRPNIIVLLVDNVRADEFGITGHPYLKTPNVDRLAREGAIFRSYYVTTPLCSPSRASILTGQYVSRHGIIDNSNRSRASHDLHTFAQDLQRLGYETGYLGKWHMGNDPTPRPGWNYWVSYRGQGLSANPELFEDGKTHQVEGHVTDIMYDRAIRFVRRPRGGKPFLLYVAHKAVHPDVRQLDDGSPDFSTGGGKHVPAERHRGRFQTEVWPAAPNWLAPGTLPEGKPMLRRILERRALPDFEPKYGEFMRYTYGQDYIRSRAEVLLSIDEGLAELRKALEEQGILDQTMIVFTSDNGEFFGAHGLTTEIRLPYEDALKVPLFIRYPPLVKPGTTIGAHALNIDLAPTLIEVAGGRPRPEIQGRSLLPLLRGPVRAWRRSVMYELTGEEQTFPWLVAASYRAVRMGRYKYIHWISQDRTDELYDLERDPFEMANLMDRPGMQPTVVTLRRELARLVTESMGLGVDR